MTVRGMGLVNSSEYILFSSSSADANVLDGLTPFVKITSYSCPIQTSPIYFHYITLSLKNLGSVTKNADLLGLALQYSKATTQTLSKDQINAATEAFANLSPKMQQVAMNTREFQSLGTEVQSMITGIDASLLVTGKAGAEGAVGVTTLGAAFSGLGTALVAAAPYIAAFAAIGLAIAAVNAKIHEYQNNLEDAQSAQSDYESTQTELESVNSELDSTKQRMDELQSLSKSGKMTLAGEAEWQQLQRTNTELERRKSLLEAESETQAQDAVNKANKTLNAKSQNTNKDYSSGTVRDSAGGNDYQTPIKEAQGNIAKLRKYADQIADYQDQIAEAQNKGADTSKLEKSLADNLSQGVGESWFDSSKKKTLEDVNSLLSVWDTFANGYTGTEADLNNIEGFFKSNTMGDTLKNYVADLVKNGMSAKDALSSLGYSLSDLNLDDDSSLERYFIVTSLKSKITVVKS